MERSKEYRKAIASIIAEKIYTEAEKITLRLHREPVDWQDYGA